VFRYLAEPVLHPTDGRKETGQFSGGASCFTYKGIDFDNDRQELGRDQQFSYVGDDFNDKISAIRIPQGYIVVAYDNRDFTGEMTVFRSDVFYVGEHWNDRISSYKCIRAERP
jgi:hypothetical protein